MSIRGIQREADFRNKYILIIYFIRHDKIFYFIYLTLQTYDGTVTNDIRKK